MNRDENRRYALMLVSGWSCDERDRAECRNSHGCHCREITSLMERRENLSKLNHRRAQIITDLKAAREIDRTWPLPKGEL